MIEIKRIDHLRDYEKLVEIQRSAWGISDLEIEPHYLMTRVQKYGGIIHGLFVDSQLVGFTFALLGRWQDEYFIYSHMAAVENGYQGRGFGFLLKKAQAVAAREMGYSLIRWCFDPLEAQNAFFNLHRLGVVCREYERDAYGEGGSGLHLGLPTDRLIADWDVNTERVKGCLQEKRPLLDEDVNPAVIGCFDREVAYIEIPRDIRALKKKDMSEAKKWRLRCRELFEKAFAVGFTAFEVVFSKDKERIFYKLFRS